MNNSMNNTVGAKRRERPDISARLEAMLNMEEEINSLRSASYVLEEMLCSEFEHGRVTNEGGDVFPVWLNNSQIDGLKYMALHVRNIAFSLQGKFYAANGEEVQK